MTNHRVICEYPDCAKVWRENCAECAEDTAAKHRRETGHPVSVDLTSDWGWQELKKMTGLAHPVLMKMTAKKRGW